MRRTEEPADPAAQFGQLRRGRAALNPMATAAMFGIVGARQIRVVIASGNGPIGGSAARPMPTTPSSKSDPVKSLRKS
ncbi:hypothetical protein [Sphingobium sp. Ant17]|uniref:hypothetical protein n=1 Tax=Sphingobium sp. Ant17 TaxID=1461752 RepID=UPI001F37EB38|nr:hypothetical protein [Sphingobium sp. Ant17]